MLSETERIALFTIMEIPGMFTRKLNRLFGMAGSYEDILRTPEDDFRKAGLLRNRAESGTFEAYRTDSAFLERCLENYFLLSAQNVRMIDCTEAEMPAKFRELSDPPHALFIKGRLPDPAIPCAAVIGARECSEYGSEVARFFGKQLSNAGVQVLSGMAMGIDTNALEGGLEGNSGCFAVLGSGVNICYPRSSRTVYNRMCRGHGGIMSEFCPGAPALGYHFITRNRLIAALCDVLLVIEAKEKSGTTITVENALEIGRDVFALPGRITDPLGYGCNRLIREGAQILTCPGDVLEYLGIESGSRPGPLASAGPASLSEDEKKILSLLGPDPLHTEELIIRSGLTAGALCMILASLEEKAAVRSIGGACYVKCYH